MDVSRFPSELRVLAVDDDCTGLRVLKAQLKHCNYHNVTTATDAATALEMLRERKGRDDQFDLVISDIFMADGGIDGFKLLEHISLEMDIPVIHAVPKKIHEVMNVDGLGRDSVGSHLQKYRIYLKKLNEGTLKHSDPFVDEQQAWLSGTVPANSSMSVPAESSQHQKELGRHEAPPPLVGVSSSSNPCASLKSPFALGTHSVLPTQSDQHMSAQRNLDIPLQQDTRSCTSYASILRRKMLDANRGIPFDADNLFEEIANGEMPALSSHLPLQPPELANQPSVQIQSSSAGQFNQVAPSSHLPLQSPELANQPSIQIMSSAGQFNPVVEPHQFAGLSNSSGSWGTGVVSRFPDIGHIAGTSIDPTNGNNILIDQISGLVASSSQVPTFGNEYQNQMAGLMGTTAPVIGFSEQVAPLIGFGSGASSTMMPIGNTTLGSSSSNNQIGNYVMPTQMLNGGGSTGNLHEDGTVDQQYVGDQVNNNELLAETSETQNGAIDDMDGFLADWMFS
ncbi:unnamed protein product [Urochloa decumbens]|uniref:Response regulatory domain-containing protein n=1 Tax=Urochloa decumbens TaxID=240449 RepID=A0ABC9E8X0_9POAL